MGVGVGETVTDTAGFLTGRGGIPEGETDDVAGVDLLPLAPPATH